MNDYLRIYLVVVSFESNLLVGFPVYRMFGILFIRTSNHIRNTYFILNSQCKKNYTNHNILSSHEYIIMGGRGGTSPYHHTYSPIVYGLFCLLWIKSFIYWTTFIPSDPRKFNLFLLRKGLFSIFYLSSSDNSLQTGV